MKNTFLLIAILGYFSASGQYYYNDLISAKETSRQMETYLTNKVRSVTATGFDQRGMKSPDFNEWHDITNNGAVLKITSRDGQSVSRVYYHFENVSRLTSVTDSGGGVLSSTTYAYDAAGRISSVRNSITDTANDFNQSETHLWEYNTAGKPEKLWRIINNSDSLEVRFTLDEYGNPAEERMYKKGVETGAVFYYYDEKNRLTDIVRFNIKAKRLLPDYMFEYDDKDRVIQKITTTTSQSMGYFIWRYLFNEKGLKTKEALFDKEKQLTGKIEYAYTFLE